MFIKLKKGKKEKKVMEVISIIISIVSLIILIIPKVGTIAYIPAVIGLFLGIIAVSINKEDKSRKKLGIIGIIISAIAIFICYIVISKATIKANETFANDLQKSIMNSMQSTKLDVNADLTTLNALINK